MPVFGETLKLLPPAQDECPRFHKTQEDRMCRHHIFWLPLQTFPYDKMLLNDVTLRSGWFRIPSGLKDTKLKASPAAFFVLTSIPVSLEIYEKAIPGNGVYRVQVKLCQRWQLTRHQRRWNPFLDDFIDVLEFKSYSLHALKAPHRLCCVSCFLNTWRCTEWENPPG